MVISTLEESMPSDQKRRLSHLAAVILLAGALLVSIAQGIVAQPSIPLVDVKEEIRIKSNDSVSDMLLTGISDLAVLPDGRILTAHTREAVVRVFDQAGRLIKVIGRRGDGPGEFRSPVRARYVGDRIWVDDLGAQRYKLFDARTYAPVGSVVKGATGGYFLGLVSDTMSFHHTVAGDSARIGIFGRTGERRIAIDLPIRHAGHHFEVTVAEVSPGGLLTGRMVPRRMYSPLAVVTRLEPAPGGREVFVLEASELWNGPPGAFTIRRIETATGRISAPVTAALPVRRVTPAEADSLITASAPTVRRPRDARSAEEYRQKARVPTTYPAFAAFMPSTDGVLWLTEYARPDTRLVVDHTGKPLMRVRLPTGFRVLAVSRTHVWGYTLDADDLPIISRYRVQT
jgi:hypothetical protein